MDSSGLLRLVPLILTLICWSLPPIMIRWLNEAGLDVYTMNLYRMFAGSLFLIPFGLWFNFKGMKQAAKKPWKFLVPALLLSVVMIVWVMGLLRLGATVASLVGRTNVIFLVLIGVLFFADERVVLLDKWFLVALATALTGVAGVMVFRDPELAAGAFSLEGSFWVGVAFVLGANLCWVVYIYSIKLMVRRTGPLVSFIMVNIEASFIILAVAVVAHCCGAANIIKPFHLDFTANLILVGSGIVGVGIGGMLFYKSVDLIGVAITQTLMLAMPVMTGLMAFIFLEERLTLLQLAAGAVLLGSLGYIVLTKARKLPPPPQPGGGKMLRGPV